MTEHDDIIEVTDATEEYRKLQTESLQEFCERWGVPLSWGYSRTRRKGKGRLPHIKAGKYCRILPQEADNWMIRNGRA